jgi:hypothetical protein
MTDFIRRRYAFALLGSAVGLSALLPAGAAGATDAGAAAGAAAVGPAGAAGAGAGTGWRVVASISVPHKSVLLENIDVVGRADAWAAGIINDGVRGQGALIENWNGSTWRRVALPAGDSARIVRNIPLVVAGASSSRNVWVFGEYGHYLRLRDGHWTPGLIPSFPRQTYIDQAAVFSPCDVWAFGMRAIGSISRGTFAILPFAIRFDGRTWRQVTIPGRASEGAFTVSVASARDMWALEGTVTPGSGIYAKPRVVHWNGRSWRPVAIQPRRPKGGTMTSILAIGPDNVWVGGSTPNSQGGSAELILHWNGRSWRAVSPPARPSEADYYAGSMTPDGRGGIWLLGTAFVSAVAGPARMWNYGGGTWSAPTVLSSRLLVWSIAAVPHSTSVWGIAGGPGLVKGDMLLYGPVPR